MDEATNGVDSITRQLLYSYIKSIQSLTAILVTHRSEEVEKVCDKIAIMNNGHFLALENIDNLKKKYGDVHIL